jgi:hypothetical protein
MKYFDSSNQDKVHYTVCNKFVGLKMGVIMSNLTRPMLAVVALELKNHEFTGKVSTNKKRWIVSYPKPVGKILYDNAAEAKKDVELFQKLLKAASKKVPDGAPHALNPAVEISTVNVITMNDGQLQGMSSWVESPEGNKAAEKKFSELAKKAGCPLDDIGACIEDGSYGEHNKVILIVHS